jgi:hypothetical protein
MKIDYGRHHHKPIMQAEAHPDGIEEMAFFDKNAENV